MVSGGVSVWSRCLWRNPCLRKSTPGHVPVSMSAFPRLQSSTFYMCPEDAGLRCTLVFVTNIQWSTKLRVSCVHLPSLSWVSVLRNCFPLGSPWALTLLTQCCPSFDFSPALHPSPFGNIPINILQSSHLQGIWQMLRIWIKGKVFGMTCKTLHDLELCCFFSLLSQTCT